MSDTHKNKANSIFLNNAFRVILAAFLTIFVAKLLFPINASEDALYVSNKYHVSLKYPSNWSVKQNYNERYEGEDGFFQLGAISGGNASIDEVAENDAFHELYPYGTNPQIIKLTIKGLEGRLILPSGDQPEDMQKQAGLIVKYPKAVKIGGSTYHYLILWADKAHIEQIGETLTFLN